MSHMAILLHPLQRFFPVFIRDLKLYDIIISLSIFSEVCKYI